MIVRITGVVAEMLDDAVVLDRDGVGYEILVCAYALAELAAIRGRDVTLHTIEYYEGSSAGGNLIPRMVGFLRPEERVFFNRFTKVKGMGVRKAIKALAQPIAQVAAAIESGDEAALGKLPGVGKRGASQIIAELRGKVTEFALAAPVTETEVTPEEEWTAELRDAMEILVALGEKRQDAQRWLERARQSESSTKPTDEWVRLAYRVRSMSG